MHSLANDENDVVHTKHDRRRGAVGSGIAARWGSKDRIRDLDNALGIFATDTKI